MSKYFLKTSIALSLVAAPCFAQDCVECFITDAWVEDEITSVAHCGNAASPTENVLTCRKAVNSADVFGDISVSDFPLRRERALLTESVALPDTNLFRDCCGLQGDVEATLEKGGFCISFGHTAGAVSAGEAVVRLPGNEGSAKSESVVLPEVEICDNGGAEVLVDGLHPFPYQIHSAEGLLQREGTGSVFTVLQYLPQDLMTDLDTNGYYVVCSGASPVTKHTFLVATNSISLVTVKDGVTLTAKEITRTADGFAQGVPGCGSSTFKETAAGTGLKLREWQSYNTDGSLASYRSELVTNTPYGNLPVSETYGTGAAARTTRIDYWLYGCPSGVAGRVKRRIEPDGSSISCLYDEMGRTTNTLSRCPGAPDVMTVFSYEPFLPTNVIAPPAPAWPDVGKYETRTPRIESVYVGGILARRTLRATSVDPVKCVYVEELVLHDPSADPVAAWVAGAGLRTVTVQMPENDCRACSKRKRAEFRPDGTLSIWNYGSGDYTSGTADAPGTFEPAAGGLYLRTERVNGTLGFTNGIPYRTTKEVMVENRATKAVVLRETYVCTSVSPNSDECVYERVSWTETFRDAQNREILTRSSDGTTTRKAWTAGRLAASTAADGTVTSYEYDNAGRVSTTTVTAPGRLPVATVVTYDGAGRELSRVTSSGGLSEGEFYDYDTAGNRTLSVSRGVTNLYAYSEVDGLSTETVIRAPGTGFAVTNTTVRRAGGTYSASYVNGEMRSASLSRTIPGGFAVSAFFTGTDISGGETFPSNSPARTESVTLPSGLTLAQRSPAFGGGFVTVSNTYNTIGKPIETVKYAPDGTVLTRAFHRYDALGNCVLSAFDSDLDGVYTPTNDIAFSNAVSYVQIKGEWWRNSRKFINTYSPFSSSKKNVKLTGPRIIFLNREKLTGLGHISEDEYWQTKIETSFYLGAKLFSRYRVVNSRTGKVCWYCKSSRSGEIAFQVMQGGLLLTNRTDAGITTSYDYDALGRISSQTDEFGNVTEYMYDERGNIVAESAPCGVTTHSYDALNRRIATTDPYGNTTRTAYDNEDRVIAIWGAARAVRYGYDACGRMVSRAITRDPAPTVPTETPSHATGNWDTTRWLYDGATGLLTNQVNSNGAGPSFSYMPDGRPSSRTWARGVVTTYSYDKLGRPSKISYSDGTPPVLFSYDIMSLLKSVVVPDISTNTYKYLAGSVDGISLEPAGILATFWANTFGPFQTAFAAGVPYGSSPPYYSCGIIYDKRGLPHSYEIKNRLLGKGYWDLYIYVFATPSCKYLPGTDVETEYRCGDFVRTVNFDAERRMIASVTNSFRGKVISSFDYAADESGNRRVIARTVPELDSETSAADASAVTSKRLAGEKTAEPENFVYDADGNLLYDGRFTYFPDAENRISVVSNDNVVVRYSYDHRNRMIWKKIAAPGGVAKSIKFDWIGSNIIVEREYTNGVLSRVRRNMWGLGFPDKECGNGHNGCAFGGPGKILLVFLDDDAYFPAYDADGNVYEYVSTNGTVVAHYEYSPSGEPIVAEGPLANAFIHRHATQPWCPVTGRYEREHLKRRHDENVPPCKHPYKMPWDATPYFFLESVGRKNDATVP